MEKKSFQRERRPFPLQPEPTIAPESLELGAAFGVDAAFMMLLHR